MEAMRYVREVGACRRGLNSHETAKSRKSGCRRACGPKQKAATRLQPSTGAVSAAEWRNYLGPQCHSEQARCEKSLRVQPVRRAAICKITPGRGQLLRFEFAGCYGRQRRAVSARYAPREITRPWQSISRTHRAQRCLTPRSSGAPTAGHQARSAARYILHSPGLASHRRRPLSSNVRQRNGSYSVRLQSQRLSA